MKKLILVGVAVVALAAVPLASASDHPLVGCLHCRMSNVHNLIGGGFLPFKGHVHTGGVVMQGNCAFGPCGGACVPGPWYTYWPCEGMTNLTSAYATPNWTYRDHFQTPVPLGGGIWHTPQMHTPGFAAVPYYWSAR